MTNFFIDYWEETLSVVNILVFIGQIGLIWYRKKNKRVYRLLKELRKGMREHHQTEAKLFRGIDKVMVTLALRSLEMPKKEEKEEGWSEYG